METTTTTTTCSDEILRRLIRSADRYIRLKEEGAPVSILDRELNLLYYLANILKNEKENTYEQTNIYYSTHPDDFHNDYNVNS